MCKSLRKYALVEDEIRAVVEEVAGICSGGLVKVIIETCYLNDEEKMTACQMVERGGAHFVKTSIGFGSGGATVADVALIRRMLAPGTGVKAAGGIRTLEQARAMIEAGASRLGTTSAPG